MSTRHAMVAGMFYPAEAARLRREVAAYVEDSGVAAGPGRVAALVAPHAGYMYSGPTAGYAYARIKGSRPGRVILLGRSHHYYFDGAAIYDGDAFETPLQDFPVDREFAATLKQGLREAPANAHYPEHGLEVQLPFLSVMLGRVPIVPILFGSDAEPFHIEFGRRLAAQCAPDDLVVASTDLSHYYPQQEAERLDRASLDAVLAKDCAQLCASLKKGDCAMCGAPAVVAAMAFALERGAEEWQLLDYRTSAQASGDYKKVVGYGAISMETAAA